jgi:hypothetical protein
MPSGTRVDRCFQGLKEERGVESAARICQSATRQSLQTGRKPKGKSLSRPQVKCSKLFAGKCSCQKCKGDSRA